MHVVTTTNLLSKYNITADVATALLTKLSPNVTILPAGNCTSIKAFTDTINDSILLFGGNDIVPMFVVGNPCNDPDQTVMTDSPYMCKTDSLFLVPDTIVGRLPDEDNGHQYDFLTTIVENQRQHLAGQVSTSGWLAYVANVWGGIGGFMNSHFNMQNLVLSPPTIQSNFQSSYILGKKYHYINMHGTTANGNFYSQINNTYPIAMQVTPGYFSNSIAFFEPCYGAYLNARNRNTSILLQALLSSACAIIGSTEIAYGPAQGSPDGCDLLSYCFYEALLQGQGIGEAFLNAKKNFASTLMTRDHNILPSNRKTLLSFNLYGTPDIRI